VAANSSTPEEILSEALSLRAEAYRRWRQAAAAELQPSRRGLYEALARFECDRYDELARRFFAGGNGKTADQHNGSGFVVAQAGTRHSPLRAAAIAAEAERRAWYARLRRAPESSPERLLLTALVEEARRARDMVGPRGR
jgi:hypothetical protein